MYLFLLIFCIFGYIVNADDSGDSNDEGKFIDLLPDEEKDAFLESVARRLISEVKTKDARYKSGEEVSDEALNQQSQYVQKVLQEESDNLRRSGKIKVDSDEKIKVQGLDKSNKPDDNDKDHIDLTLRQSFRRKRNEGDNEEFIPVKTVYDDENDRPLNTVSNTKDDEDGTKSINTKSKENIDENSTTEDIQVRGPRHRARDLSQAITDHSNLRDSSLNATVIDDFEPGDSSEYVTSPNDEDVFTDKIEKEETETATFPEVKISSEIDSDVKSSHNTFTESIFEPIEAESEEDKKSEESVTDTTTTETTTTVEVTEEITTEHALTTTQESVKETTTIENIVQNTTNKKHILRVHDNVDIKKELENPLNNTEKGNNRFIRKTDEIVGTNFNVTTSKVLKSSVVQGKNDFFDSLSNHTGITAENKSFASNEQDQTEYNSKNNRDNSSDANHSVEKGQNVSHRDDTSTTAASPSDNDVKNNHSSVEINEKYIDVNETTENHLEVSKEIHERTEKFSELNNVKENSSEISNLKNSKEDRSSKENNNYFTTTEHNEQDNKTYYVTKEVNTSYGTNNANNLRTNINTQEEGNNLNNINIVPVKSNQVESYNIEHKNPDSLKQVQFEETSEKKEIILTTTEKISKNTYKNDSTLPKYSVYYSKYVLDDAKEGNSDQNDGNDLNNNKNEKYDEKDGGTLKYESQSANLEKIKSVLRDRLSQEVNEQSEETIPKLFQSSGKMKEYLVYEIPADVTPFVQTNLEPKEEPYYAPVHNYAPNNAYYNAYNNLGPNDEDNSNDGIITNIHEEDDISAESLGSRSTESFSYDNLDEPDEHRKKFKFNRKKPRPKETLKVKVVKNSNSLGLPIVLKRPKYTQILFNPDEYLDMDYYFGRSNSQPKTRTRKKRKPRSKIIKRAESYFPNSNEESHPYNSLSKDNIKGHMAAVRQMLYQQKLFGFVTGITPKPANESITNYHEHHKHKNDPDDVTSFRSENRSDYIIILPNGKPKNDYPNQQDIAVDYYFGLYNTENQPEGKRYEDFLRKSQDEYPEYTQNETKLSGLVGEIRRQQRRWNRNVRSHKNKDLHQEEVDEWKKNAGTIKDILEIGETRDIFQNLEKLQQMNLTLMRRRESDEDVKVYVNVLKDMVKMDNRAMEKFDWLGSTVDVLGAIKKLKYLTNHQYNQKDIHPADLQLLQYVLYLFKVSRHSMDDTTEEKATLRGQTRKNRLPRNKKRMKQHITNLGSLNTVWLYVRQQNGTRGEINQNDLDFLEFLDDLEYSLFDLHTAIKHIAMVTNYKKQRWFMNLKSLYLKKTKKKELLETLLHIFTTRLLELIERNSVASLKDGYLQYIEQNEKEVKRTKQEFVFVLKLLREIKNLNN